MTQSCRSVNFLHFLQSLASTSEPSCGLMWKYLNLPSRLQFGLSVSRLLLLKPIQNINISALFPIPLLPEVGCLGTDKSLHKFSEAGVSSAAQAALTDPCRGPGDPEAYNLCPCGCGPGGLHPEIHSVHRGPSGHVTSLRSL